MIQKTAKAVLYGEGDTFLPVEWKTECDHEKVADST